MKQSITGAGPSAAATLQDRLKRERDLHILIAQRREEHTRALARKRELEETTVNLGVSCTRYTAEEAEEKCGHIPRPSASSVRRREEDRQQLGIKQEELAQTQARLTELDAEMQHLRTVELPQVSSGCNMEEWQAAQHAVSQAQSHLKALREAMAQKSQALEQLAPAPVVELQRQLEDLLAHQAVSAGEIGETTVTDSLLRTQIAEVEEANAQKARDGEDLRAALAGLGRQASAADKALAEAHAQAERTKLLFLEQYGQALALEYRIAAEAVKGAFLRLVGLHTALEGNGLSLRVLPLAWYEFLLVNPLSATEPNRPGVLFKGDEVSITQRYSLAEEETMRLNDLGLDIVKRR